VYVALTRAEEMLAFTGSTLNGFASQFRSFSIKMLRDQARQAKLAEIFEVGTFFPCSHPGRRPRSC